MTSTFSEMRRWKITWPALLVLTIAVGVIVVLLIAPDVDPPDTAFQRGTAPIVVHAQTSSGPVVMATAGPVQDFARIRTTFTPDARQFAEITQEPAPVLSLSSLLRI